MSKKIATTVYITQKQQDQLRELNQKSKVPVAEYIRQGIDLIIEQQRDRYTENKSHLPPGKNPTLSAPNHKTNPN